MHGLRFPRLVATRRARRANPEMAEMPNENGDIARAAIWAAALPVADAARRPQESAARVRFLWWICRVDRAIDGEIRTRGTPAQPSRHCIPARPDTRRAEGSIDRI
jgi:hypothetical protein